MGRLRVLWINTKADFTGGCESYIYHTAGLLKKHDVDNILLYGVEGWTEPQFTNQFKEAYPLVTLNRQINEIKPDIIYVHRLEGYQNLSQLTKCRIPVIRFYHDHKLFCLREHKYRTLSHKTCTKPTGLRCIPCLGFLGRGKGKLKIKYNSLSRLHKEQRENRKLSGFVVASQYMKDHLTAHGFDPSKIKVLPLYPFREVDQPGELDDNYLLYAGQILRGKGIDTLLQAVKIMKNRIKLVIAGTGRQKEEYEKMMVDLGLQKQVSFIGFVKQEKLINLYKKCTCLVMPSRVPETFGLSGLEAMSFAKPVIASAVGGIGQWLKDGENGFLIPSNDALALAGALDKLAGDRALAAQMGKTGYEMFKDNFMPEHHITGLMKYIKELTQEDTDE